MYNIHRLHVMNRRRRDVDKGQNLSLDIIHRVNLDTALRGSEFRPFEHAQAQIADGRVKRIFAECFRQR